MLKIHWYEVTYPTDIVINQNLEDLLFKGGHNCRFRVSATVSSEFTSTVFRHPLTSQA